MKTTPFWFISMVCACLFACSDSTTLPASKNAMTGIQGLASPIQLSYDSTLVYLSDYFVDYKKISAITFEGSAISMDSTGKAYLIGNAKATISSLKVDFEGNTYAIPVFKSEMQAHTFTYQPSSDLVQKVEMAGTMNGWNRKATLLEKKDGRFQKELILAPGLYQYRIWADDKELMDANNPNTVPNGLGAYNNTFAVGNVNAKRPQILSHQQREQVIEILCLDTVDHAMAYFNNEEVPVHITPNALHITLSEHHVKQKEGMLRIYAARGSLRSNDILLPIQNGQVVMKAEQITRQDMHKSIMYFLMVDRFFDGKKENNAPTNDPSIQPQANNLGGDLKGISDKIRSGYFQKLGINTIWVSPITTNAEGAWGLWNKELTSTFSAYHGYWPTSLRSIDHRFGTEAEFKELIALAHANNMNVVLDYVAHHVHQNHPLLAQQPDWTTPLHLPDGRINTELWDEERLTTWFDIFLPTLNYAKPEVVDALSDTAMHWVTQYDLDGFRHDATKHIREEFWRALTTKVKKYQQQHPERKVYQIGETYGSPELIRSYISSGQMDAQFDFNLYDAMVDAFGKTDSDFANLQRVLEESMRMYGHHHMMGNITGNQDRARFISYADGSIQFGEDAKLAGWTRDIQNKGATGFERLRMLTAFLLTTPGIPCIYYGDEIGMPGGNDPDNRRLMRFDQWNQEQQTTFDQTQKLIALRNENMALIYGDTKILKNDDEALIYCRSYMGQHVLVVMDKSIKSNENWKYEIPAWLQASYRAGIEHPAFQCDGHLLTCHGGAHPSGHAVAVFVSK